MDRIRKYESIVYAVLWLLILLLPFFNEFMGAMVEGSPFSWCYVIRWWTGLIPFVVVFVINNFILIPRLLINRISRLYLPLLLLIIILFVAYQILTYEYRFSSTSNYTFLAMPMPMVMNVALLLLLIAVNTAIMMMFRYIREREKSKSLENIRLKDEIKFLKAQINPHFFMNMLNNIHAMIEFEPGKAQDMTLELSKLMRHVLYEGESMTVSFASESAFIASYVALMRRRYPESKVEISLQLPENPSKEIMIPPMLFVTFVENAFKHGVSYQIKSRISISLTESDGMVSFRCSNTYRKSGRKFTSGGVGLDNLRRRLDLLYSNRYELHIGQHEDMFDVVLTIPSL